MLFLTPRLVRRSFGSLLLVPLTVLAATSSASAQTDSAAADSSNRAAARELATQGLQLQQAGNFTEALDRFDRAQTVFNAPTHLLHIAECEAALGKLVESAETYRTLAHMTLEKNPPAAFVQAQQEGTAELAQVEPRIPSIRIIVRPHAIRNTVIYIDNDTQHPMSDALIGVPRPTDPGVHTISLLAPGYARADQQITLKEKETKDIAFNLGSPGGFYTPQSQPQAGAQPAPQPYVAQPYVAQPYGAQQPMYTQQPMGPPPEPPPARGGFVLGATLGGLIPAGNALSNVSLGSVASGGAAVQINGGFRFANRLYMGLTFEHGFLSAGDGTTGTLPPGGTASADSNYIGFDFAVISNPDGVGFFGKIGVGYRIVDVSATSTTSAGSFTYSGDLNGAEFTLAAGVHIKLGDWIRLIPGGSVSIGQFSNENTSGNFPGFTPTSGSISNPDTHEFILLGVTALVDFSRKH